MTLRLVESTMLIAQAKSETHRLIERLLGYQRKKVSFHLSHVFLSEFLPQLKQARSLEAAEQLQHELEALLHLQIESFLQEKKGPPIQRPYFESLQQSQEALSFRDNKYKNQRSSEHPSAMAVAIAADPITQKRYDLEEQQLYELRRLLVDELHSPQITELESKETPAAPNVRQELQRQGLCSFEETQKIYTIGHPILYTSPKSPVHEGDKAFVYLCRNIYVPAASETILPEREILKRVQQKTALGKIFLVFDPLYTDLKNAQLAQIHENLQNGSTKILPSETSLLLTFSRLEQEYSSLSGYSIFRQILSQLDKKLWTDIALQQEQKTLQLATLEPRIQTVITFLTQVFLLETCLFSSQNFSPSQLAQNLYFALGTGLTAITNGAEFTLEKAWQAYGKATGHEYPSGISLQQLQLRAFHSIQQIDSALISQFDSPQILKQASLIRLSRNTRKQFQEGMKLLPQSGTGLLDLLGDTLCNGLEFGNFIDVSNFNPSISAQALQGMPITSLEQARALGLQEDQLKMLKQGFCTHPHCPNKGVEQLIHDCSEVCIGCWLRSMHGGSSLSAEQAHEFLPSLPQDLAGTFRDFRDLVSLFSSNDLLPSFFANQGIVDVWEAPAGTR